MEQVKISDYHKYKETFDTWRANNRDHTNEYYRNYHKNKRMIKNAEKDKQFVIQYLKNNPNFNLNI